MHLVEHVKSNLSMLLHVEHCMFSTGENQQVWFHRLLFFSHQSPVAQHASLFFQAAPRLFTKSIPFPTHFRQNQRRKNRKSKKKSSTFFWLLETTFELRRSSFFPTPDLGTCSLVPSPPFSLASFPKTTPLLSPPPSSCLRMSPVVFSNNRIELQ